MASQYVGADDTVQNADVSLSVTSGEGSETVLLSADEALQVTLALVDARELTQRG